LPRETEERVAFDFPQSKNVDAEKIVTSARSNQHKSARFAPSTITDEERNMARQLTPFEALSYELNLLRERRLTQRRLVPRDSLDRRQPDLFDQTEHDPDAHTLDSSNQTP
jgi:hypothetical protein